MGNMMKLLLVLCLYRFAAAAAAEPLMVPLTLIDGAEAIGAGTFAGLSLRKNLSLLLTNTCFYYNVVVCLDGSPAAYNLDRGHGSGRNSWLVQLGGGAWCNTVEDCVARKTLLGLGSSKHMEKELLFEGILSNKAAENPDFYNWNRVKLRYCDGACFSGDGQIEDPKLYFRGQLIWTTAMKHFMTKEGMQNATQAIFSGCSAGGLAAIIHCDEFRDLFPQSTKVKCLSDAGMFLDVMDITGGHTRRDVYADVVSLHGVAKNLPASCTSKHDPTSCFFPQNLINDVKTPMFILNAAYDSWQIQRSLVPNETDPHGDWNRCKADHRTCNSSQIQVFQDFRNEMLNVLKTSGLKKNGVFINSCFAHCQSENQTTWFERDSPRIGKKRVAEAVGNWYFDRTNDVKAIDCAYPCGHNCVNVI